jgi:voltage-gated potassium channel
MRLLPERTEERYRRFERAVGPVMLILSVLFIPVFILSLLPQVRTKTGLPLEEIEWAIWAVFVAEYLVRFTIAPVRWRMVRNHVFDLIVIALPFMRGLRGLRAVRSFTRSLFALGGTASMGRALATARQVARRRGPRYALLLVSVATIAGAIIVLNVEFDAPDSNIQSFGDALWWAVSTVTTVGYGDRYPTTSEGRAVAFVLMVLGLGLFSVVTARIASFFLAEEEQDGVSARLERIEALLQQREPSPRGESQPPRPATDNTTDPTGDEAAAVRTTDHPSP